MADMKTVQELVDAEFARLLAADAVTDAAELAAAKAAFDAQLAAALATDNAQDAVVLKAKDDEIAALKAALKACQDNQPPAGDTTAPSVPGKPTATVVSSSQINISWPASTDAVGVAGYNIFRNGVKVGSRVGTSYSDTGLTASTTYTYGVTARDAVGNTSNMSAVVTAKTSAVVPPVGTLLWPKTADTGVPAGTVLAPYSGPMQINTAGTVVENKTIKGQLVINAANVIVRNCAISNFGNYGVLGENHTFTVEDCTFDGRGSTGTKAIAGKGGTWQRNNIFGMVIAIDMWGGPGLIEGNYIHDLAETSTDINKRHFDGIAVLSGGKIVIRHNAIEIPSGTAAVFLSSQFSPIDDILVENNLLKGGSYPAYAEASRAGPMTNVRYLNNHLEYGDWGYLMNNSNSVDQGNVKWKDGVDPVPAPVVAWRTAA